MKKIIAGLLLTASVFTFAQAETVPTVPNVSLCDAHRELAEATMGFRQTGGDRAELDAVVYSEHGQAIADMAWARGVVPESVKKAAIQGFADHVKNQCLKATQK
ncbi:hypothetical protein D3C75_625730 [compost metagenome]